METFETLSYKTKDNRWIPYGVVHIDIGGRISEELSIDYTPLEGKTFDTKEAADEFFLQCCKAKKYKSALN